MENEKEEEADAVQLCDTDDDPNEPFVCLFDNKSEKHQADADFDGHGREDVNWFA